MTESYTILEACAAYRPYGLREGDRGERPAVVEGVVADSFQVVSQQDLPERRTAVECTVCYPLAVVGQCHGQKAVATEESPVSDAFHLVSL